MSPGWQKIKSPLWNFSQMIYHGFLNLSIFNKNQDLLCDQSNVALTPLSWRAFPLLLWQTNQNQWDERWSLQIKELLLQQCNILVFKCSVSDGYPLKLQYVDLVILSFRMTVTHVRSSSIGKCQQAAIFLLLFLTHPSLPRQVGWTNVIISIIF